MIDAIINEKSLPTILMIEAMEMMYLPHQCKTASKKPVFLMRKMITTPAIHFFTLKYSIEQLQSRDETLVPDDVTYDNILTFDEYRSTR